MKAITYENAINHWRNGYLAWNPKKYDYYIKISSKETIDNITKSDYIYIIQDFEHKIKQSMIKNKIDALSKDFTND